MNYIVSSYQTKKRKRRKLKLKYEIKSNQRTKKNFTILWFKEEKNFQLKSEDRMKKIKEGLDRVVLLTDRISELIFNDRKPKFFIRLFTVNLINRFQPENIRILKIGIQDVFNDLSVQIEKITHLVFTPKNNNI